MINKKKLLELELKKKQKKVSVLDECLPYQLEFINDPSQYKAVCGTRRAAKSFMFALYLINQAITVPKSKCIYMGLTNDSCKQIMWSDIIEVIFDKYKIEADCSSKYEINFANGSVIFLRGLDATPNQMNRLRGQKFDIACIDEAQDFTQDVDQLIDGVLKMSLAQTGATLCMGGTPGNKLGTHYWFRVWKPKSLLNQWKLFKFSWRNNSSIEPKTNRKVCDAIQEAIEKDIQRNPLIKLTPQWRREVDGEWVLEDNVKVYKSSEQNYINDLPKDFVNKNTKYILSTDLGYNDGTTFVISAYNQSFDNCYYIIQSFKKNKIIISEIATIMHALNSKYHFVHMVVDAGAQGKQITEELKQIHHLPLTAAKKYGKEAHIALINSDFITGNVKIIRADNQELIQELETLIWDEKLIKEGIYIENQTMHNDLCDALQYGHNFSRHYWFHPPQKTLSYDNPEDIPLLMKQNLPPQEQEINYSHSIGQSIFEEKSVQDIVAEFKYNNQRN